MRLTEISSAGGVTAPGVMLLAAARAAQEKAGDAATRLTALEAELAALERVGLAEHTMAGNRAEPV